MLITLLNKLINLALSYALETDGIEIIYNLTSIENLGMIIFPHFGEATLSGMIAMDSYYGSSNIIMPVTNYYKLDISSSNNFELIHDGKVVLKVTNDSFSSIFQTDYQNNHFIIYLPSSTYQLISYEDNIEYKLYEISGIHPDGLLINCDNIFANTTITI